MTGKPTMTAKSRTTRSHAQRRIFLCFKMPYPDTGIPSIILLTQPGYRASMRVSIAGWIPARIGYDYRVGETIEAETRSA